jgi:ubiquinone biosynthesis monooxygenase Coq6
MQVWQANSPATLTFTSRDIEDDPTSKDLYLGACVEDQPLVCALWEQLQNHDVNAVTTNAKTSVDCYTNVSSLESVGIGNVGSLATVTMHDGKKLEAAVLVGADGGNSFVRKATGISRVGLEYEQHALTFTVELDSAAGSTMERRAFQRYLSDGGPMALLPTYSPNHAVIVWSTSPDNISTWKDAADEDLVAHLNQCLREGPQRVPPLFEALTGSSSGGDGGHSTTTATPTILSNLAYGADRVLDTVHYGLAMASHHPDPTFRVPPVISKIVSRKFNFPLSCFQATTYVKGRVALVGDAAHSVHPMAGQGLNLGLGDVDSLVNSLEKAARAGMDLSSFLQEYNTQRHRSVSVSLAGIHALQRMFRNQTAPLQHAKTFGMNMIQNFGPMRRRLAVAAAHGVAL